MVPAAAPAGNRLLNVNQPPRATLPPVFAVFDGCHTAARSGPFTSSEVATIQYCVPAVTAVDVILTLTNWQQTASSGILVELPPASRVPTTPDASLYSPSVTNFVPEMYPIAACSWDT